MKYVYYVDDYHKEEPVVIKREIVRETETAYFLGDPVNSSIAKNQLGQLIFASQNDAISAYVKKHKEQMECARDELVRQEKKLAEVKVWAEKNKTNQ